MKLPKLPKIPRLVWILGGLAAGAYFISRKFSSSGSGSFLGDALGGLFGGSANSKGPQVGPGLYSSWNAGRGFWGVYDGAYKVEQVRIGFPDASQFRVMLDGELITVTYPNGNVMKWKRQKTSGSNVLPPTIK